jgi:hypothetical protein
VRLSPHPAQASPEGSRAGSAGWLALPSARCRRRQWAWPDADPPVEEALERPLAERSRDLAAERELMPVEQPLHLSRVVLERTVLRSEAPPDVHGNGTVGHERGPGGGARTSAAADESMRELGEETDDSYSVVHSDRLRG